MPYDFAYNQLLTLIAARSQQWLRNQIDLMPQDAISGTQIDDVAEIAVAAHICTGLRGTEAPLQAFIRSRSTPEFTDLFMARFQSGKAIRAYLGTAVLRCLSPDRLDWPCLLRPRRSCAVRSPRNGWMTKLSNPMPAFLPCVIALGPSGLVSLTRAPMATPLPTACGSPTGQSATAGWFLWYR